MHARWFAIAALFLVACGNLDAIDYVHDLRMLAVRADPPDQLVDPNQLIAGAPVGASHSQPVQLTALVAWPNGQGGPIQYTFTTCAKLDPNTQNCLTSDAAYQVLASGTTTAPTGTVEITTTFTASDALLVQAAELDAYRGLDGLRLPVNLTLTTATDQLVGTKLVVYFQPIAGIPYVANQNPNITGVLVESTPWPNPGTFTFSTAARPKDGWDITPVYDPNEEVSYEVQKFSGEPLSLTESWLFDYFNTFGDYFSPSTAGGTAIFTNTVNAVASHWNPPDASAPTPGTFYVVVRDGRGGENWLVLDAELTP